MPIKRWRTREMIQLLSDLYWTTEQAPQGGDHDSEGLVLRAKEALDGSALFVRGFVTEGKVIPFPKDCGIELVEVSNGTSEGGLTSQDPATVRMYGLVRAKLAQMGFDVVPTMSAYF